MHRPARCPKISKDESNSARIFSERGLLRSHFGSSYGCLVSFDRFQSSQIVLAVNTSPDRFHCLDLLQAPDRPDLYSRSSRSLSKISDSSCCHTSLDRVYCLDLLQVQIILIVRFFLVVLFFPLFVLFYFAFSCCLLLFFAFFCFFSAFSCFLLLSIVLFAFKYGSCLHKAWPLDCSCQ